MIVSITFFVSTFTEKDHILINLPLGKQEKHAELGKHQFPPEIISDYVHSVLESDREIYSKYIVDRLKNKNII